ncbi:MAG: TniQ family protein [Crinalium sp.]
MLDNQLKTYEPWEITKPLIPSRSRLYQLEPVGIGTPIVESLTSYILRLAEVHCLKPRLLIAKQIAPILKPDQMFESLEKTLNINITVLNGTGLAVAKLVQALEELTYRRDLSFLTMLTWADVIPKRGLINKVKAWCPVCYEEWRINRQVIYDQLLWILKLITVCPIHYCRLQNQCPHCYKKSRLYIWQQPGYCPNCSKWLGTVETVKEMINEKDIWIANNVGQLLASASKLSTLQLRERIKELISEYIDKAYEGGLSALARDINLDKELLSSWRLGKNTPSLNHLLHLCNHIGISLIDFLDWNFVPTFTPKKTARLEYSSKGVPRLFTFDKGITLQVLQQALEEIPPPSLIEVQNRLGYKCHKSMYNNFRELCTTISKRYQEYKSNNFKDNLRIDLEKILASSDYPPPSLTAVCRQLGYSQGSCYKHFPELCYAISKQYKAYLRKGHEELIAGYIEEARACALSLHSQQINPTTRRIAEQLAKPGVMRNKEVQDAVYQIRKELGWE